jgi:gas vesicle protein
MAKMRFAVGAVIGAAAGIVAGVLTAPKSGRETRADIKAKAEDLKTNAAKHTEQAKAKATKVADDIKDRGERAVADVRRDLAGKK